MKFAVILFSMICLSSLVVFADEAADAKAFLDKEAKVAKTEKTASGMLFRTTKEGKGPSPISSDRVTVKYKGTDREGKIFDQNEKITFPLNQVIPCWTEALQKIKVGGSATIVCPAAIAYGDRGMGPIKPGAALKFEVSLLDIPIK